MRWVLLAALLVAATAAPGCDSGGTECECPATGLTVSLPPALVGGVTQIVPSELACADAGVSPTPGSAAASRATAFQITPTQPGQCQIVIYLSDGTTFSDSLTVVETTGCCAGLRTSPIAAANIDVPAPSEAGADAGADTGS